MFKHTENISHDFASQLNLDLDFSIFQHFYSQPQYIVFFPTCESLRLIYFSVFKNIKNIIQDIFKSYSLNT